MSNSCALLIFCDDFRIKDNPAFFYAAKNHQNIIALYIYDENYLGRKLGAAAKVFLHHALNSFQKLLKTEYKINLVIRQGEALEHIKQITKEIKIDAIYFNNSYTAKQILAENKIRTQFSHLKINSFTAKLLFDPQQIQTGQKSFFKVFSPFWKNCLKNQNLIGDFLAKPHRATSAHNLKTLEIAELNLLPQHQGNWHKNLIKNYEFNYDAIEKNIADFLDHKLNDYTIKRDIPSLAATSKISPYLRFGMISPRIIFIAASMRECHQRFLSELGWREFAYHTMYHHQDLATKEIKPEFAKFKWNNNKNMLQKWQKGQTGFRLVDAAMQELWQSGIMHNRTRMLTASFLIKDLLIDWRFGEEWFWNSLVDACPAVNPFSWQWIFGSGYDCAPYFRVFNPDLQKQRFDLKEEYCKRYLDKNYNLTKIVDHGLARIEAISRYKLLH